VVYAYVRLFVLPGRACICVLNAGTSPLTAVVSVPIMTLRFSNILSHTQQCQAARIVGEGSLDFRADQTEKSLDYVHADLSGDFRLRYVDGVVSLDDRREDEHRLWPSCW
jgi:hypothetical protein